MRILVAPSIALLATVTVALATEGKIEVVAAENFYGDVAQQIGGDRVSVVSILSNPDQDPHLFEISPAVIRQIAGAQIVISTAPATIPGSTSCSGDAKPGRVAIIAADLIAPKERG